MTGANKILTVSYGTFSCTLEGFDDPFNTMKAIAEYFRDLAAEDRYFGAEPATPDAAMLHQIAEREIQRRVDTKLQGNGVILTAADVPRSAPAKTPAIHVTMPANGYNPPPAPIPAVSAFATLGTESAAARLSRLRESQMHGSALAVEPLADINSRFDDAQLYTEDQDADAFRSVAPAPVPQAIPTPDATFRAESGKPQMDPDLPIRDLPIPALPETRLAAPNQEAAVAEPEIDLAVDLALSQPTDAPLAEPAYDAADSVADSVLSSLRETLAGLEGQDVQLAADISAATDGIASDEDVSDAYVSDADEPHIDFFSIVDQPGHDDLDVMSKEGSLFGAPGQDADDLAELAALDGVSLDLDDASVMSHLDEGLTGLPETAAVMDADPSDVMPVAELATVAEIPAEAPIATEKLQRAKARVIKIRRLERQPVQADQDSLSSDMTPTTVHTAVSALSAEAEADLQQELAALEAEVGPSSADQAQPAIQHRRDAAQASVAGLPSPLPADSGAAKVDVKRNGTVADDAAVDRILAQTNTALEVPETKRRRSAIAHLKAAVMATVAERKINPNASKNDATIKMDPYRQDLNQAVRSAPTPDRPSPLVLVSAQRIDRPRNTAADAHRPVPQIVPNRAPTAAPQPVKPVRPRRVTPAAPTASAVHAVAAQQVQDLDVSLTADDLDQIFATTGKQSFADFAESLGADNLPALMEAAGAYCTLILDKPSFTRPQLFHQMQQLPELGQISREDSLRGFGKLLREGRIQKSVRGQFSLSQSSPLLREAKRIAG